MSIQTSASRPAGRSVGAAALGLVVTLALMVGVVLAFVTAPLVLLGVALVAYLLVRPRGDRTTSTGPGGAPSGVSHHGFGAGVR